MRCRKKERGFTLVELMLVVMIIAILAATVAINVAKPQRKARVAKTKSDVQTLEMAVDLFQLDIGRYPDDLKELVEDTGETDWDGPYLKQRTLPKDPWQQTYYYDKNPTKGVNFDVYSSGEDKIEGTEDDIGNWVDEDD